MPVLRAEGWGGQEIDMALTLAAGKLISRATWAEVVIDNDAYSRKRVRLALKPRWSKSSDQEWLAQFSRVREVRMDGAGQNYFAHDVLRG